MKIKNNSIFFLLVAIFGVIALGCEEVESVYIPEAPTANFKASSTNVFTWQLVNFTDTSNQLPSNWQWTFEGGDPATSTAQNPIVKFSNPGTYTVSLVAGNDGGSSEKIVKTGYIISTIQPLSIPDFTTVPAADDINNLVTIVEGATVTFTDASTQDPISWEWTFEGGDPATSVEQNPVVTYSTGGTYSVTLTTTNRTGTSTPVTKTGLVSVEVSQLDPNLLVKLDFEDNLLNQGLLGSTGNFVIHPDIAAPTAEQYVAGHKGNAYKFDGSNYLKTLWSGITGDAARTFTAWVNIPASSINKINTFIHMGERVNGHKFTLKTNPSGQVQAEIHGVTFAGGQVSADTWTHIALTHSGTANSTGMKLYLNGVLVATGSNTAITIDTQPDNVMLGAGVVLNGTGQISPDAALDEVRIYNRELTDSEIIEVMND